MCDDLFLFDCDLYEIYPSEECYIYTFSDSRLTWVSNGSDGADDLIQVQMWAYDFVEGADVF